MAEPVFFGVVSRFGRLEPQKYYGIVPSELMRKGSPLLYCTRLDILPNGSDLIDQPLWKLMSVYMNLSKAGKLPPENRGARNG